MNTSVDQDRWYTALEAAELLERHYGGSARQLIADKLKDGLIQAKAERMWKSDAPDLNSAWKARHDVEAETNVQVKRSVWRDGRHWAFDLGQWRWADCRFVITRQKTGPADRTILEGVAFQAADIDKLVSAVDKSARRDTGGRPTKYEAWGELCCLLIEMHDEGTLGKTKDYPSKAKLAEALEQKLGYDPPGSTKPRLSAETLQRALKPVWERYCDGPHTPDQ